MSIFPVCTASDRRHTPYCTSPLTSYSRVARDYVRTISTPLVETWSAGRKLPTSAQIQRELLSRPTSVRRCRFCPVQAVLMYCNMDCLVLGLILACCHCLRDHSHAVSGDGTAACSSGRAGSDHCFRGGLRPSKRSAEAGCMLSRMGPLADVPLNLLTS